MSALSRRWKGDTTSRQGDDLFKEWLALEIFFVTTEEERYSHFGSTARFSKARTGEGNKTLNSCVSEK
jgi:hypothetical protein